ncbi:hypothetical protein CLU79DRAFT_705836 [Phycomyces nitens]|nr:hypothetical protein CLU79DRAFT_705836 [Phycomyces nitens]
MQQSIANGKLKIGQKLSICGAQLCGAGGPKSPLQADSSTHLSISTNGCLPAAWDTKLGYHPKKTVIRPLSSLFEDGGMITMLDIIVCRKYPLLRTEIFPTGERITKAAQEEDGLMMSRGFGDQSIHMDLRPSSLETSGQGRWNYSERNSGIGQDQHDTPERKISSYFKMAVCDYSCAFATKQDTGMATLVFSNANEMHHMDINEGSRYKVFFLTPYISKAKWASGLHFTTSRNTRWEVVPGPNKLISFYEPREVTQCDSVDYMDRFSEADMVVLVLRKDQYQKRVVKDQTMWIQTLLVTDETRALCKIDRRSTTRPLTDIKHRVICMTNLRYDAYDKKYRIPHLNSSNESETFIDSPKSKYLHNAAKSLKAWANR